MSAKDSLYAGRLQPKGNGQITDKEEKWENRSWRSVMGKRDIRIS